MTTSKYLIRCVVAVALMTTPLAACGAHAASSKPQPGLSEADIRLALRLNPAAQPKYAPIMKFHGRSRGVVRQVPISVVAHPSSATIRSFPGVQRFRIVLSYKHTRSFIDWMNRNSNKSEVAIVGGSAAVCGLIFSETVIGAPPAAAFCGLGIAFYWSSLKDAKAQIELLDSRYQKPKPSKRHACLQVTANVVPVSNIAWYDFAATKCRKVK